MDKNMKSSRNGPLIPQEIIFELFSWLSVKSLMRFRCISKSYNSLLSESDFVNIHQCRSMTRPGGTKLLVRQTGVFYTMEQNEDGKFYLQHIEDFDGFYNYSNYVDLNTYMECVNGLFCFWRESWQPVIICNPSTREVRILPHIDMKLCMCHYSLGFEPEKKIYKVFFMKPEHIKGSLENYTRIWVFALGIDESWKEIESIPQFKRFKGAVCINGVIYMVNSCINRKNIVAYDVKSESFRTVTLWKATDHMIVDFNLIEVKEKLAVIEYNGIMISGEIDMWILRKAQNEECDYWERHIIIGFTSVYEEMGRHIRHFRMHFYYYEGQIIFLPKVNYCDKFSYFCYDITRKNWKECEVQGFCGKDPIRGIYRYVESLSPLE